MYPVFPKKGSLLGGVLLISGSCIGAGMLALPILSGLSGFFPSLSMFFLAWALMTFTGLLLVEINGWFDKRVNIISMAGISLGKSGKIISWLLYLFLFYALIIAYISGSGLIFSSFLDQILPFTTPQWLVSLFFVVLFGFIVYLGTRPVDLFNRILMFGLIFAYLGMVFLGIFRIDPQMLLYTDLSYVLIPLPVLVTSFGFHNMVPTLTHYMGGDLKKMRLVVILGSVSTFVIYLIWEMLVLGVVPVTGSDGIFSYYVQGKEATEALRAQLGTSLIGGFAQVFAFFAIVTSFLAQSLSLVHFIGDGLKVSIDKNKWYLCLLALAPPTFFALTNPNIFLKALSFAGGICAVILFGILPALIVWIGRYKNKTTSVYSVKGGKVALTLVILFSTFIVIFEIIRLIIG